MDRSLLGLVKAQTKFLLAAEKERGKVYLPPDRVELLIDFGFRQLLNDNQSHKKATPGTVRVVFIGPMYPPCTTELRSLTKLPLRCLTLETHHRGSYILVKVLSHAESQSAVMAIAEDESETIVQLRIMNGVLQCLREGLEEGNILVVKEPFLTKMFDQQYCIRVDHPTDLMFISPFDNMLPAVWARQFQPDDEFLPNEWEKRGTEQVKQGKIWSAIDWYATNSRLFDARQKLTKV
jgi:hypothetical protein